MVTLYIYWRKAPCMNTCGICLDAVYLAVRSPTCNCKVSYHLKCYVKAYTRYGCPTCRHKTNYNPMFSGILSALYLNVARMITEVGDTDMPLYYLLILFCLFAACVVMCFIDVPRERDTSSPCLIKMRVFNHRLRLNINPLFQDTLDVFLVATAVSFLMPISATLQVATAVFCILTYIYIL